MSQPEYQLVRVQERGQVTIPAKLRRKLGIAKGDYVAVVATADGVLVTRPELIPSSPAPEHEPKTARDGDHPVAEDQAVQGELRDRLIGVLQRHGVQRAGLFGSFARDEAAGGSDVDVLIEPPADMSLFGHSGLKQDLQEALGRKVDLVTYAALDPRLKEKILADEIRVL